MLPDPGSYRCYPRHPVKCPIEMSNIRIWQMTDLPSTPLIRVRILRAAMEIQQDHGVSRQSQSCEDAPSDRDVTGTKQCSEPCGGVPDPE
jgi:hypothetical protein